MTERPTLIRNIQYKTYIEEFIISALVAILGIRLFLKLTSYPQLGSDTLHISHMLWGGLLMLIALMLLLTFLNTSIKPIATIIGGVGFGTFIDELGKFITSDNNYFYKPTFALIYLLFIILYLILYFFDKRHEFTKKEYMINSIELFKDAAIEDLDTEEQERALIYLKKGNISPEMTATLEKLYKNLHNIQPITVNTFTRVKNMIRDMYRRLMNAHWFQIAIISFFILEAVVSVIITIIVILSRNASLLPSLLLSHSFSTRSFSTIDLYTTLLSLILVLIGVSRIYTSRLSAYLFFKKSILISIFITKFFSFYHDPQNAFVSLIFNIFVLAGLNYMIEQESQPARNTTR